MHDRQNCHHHRRNRSHLHLVRHRNRHTLILLFIGNVTLELKNHIILDVRTI